MARESRPEVPAGISKGSFFRRKVWDFLFGGKFPIKGEGNVTVAWDSASGIYYIKSKAVAPSTAAIDCLKYDATKASVAGLFYKVRATDTAVTDGVDVDGDTVFATPGKYLCLQAVPATPTTSAQVPQLPDPAGTDPESTSKYWEYFCPADICVDGSTVNV